MRRKNYRYKTSHRTCGDCGKTLHHATAKGESRCPQCRLLVNEKTCTVCGIPQPLDRYHADGAYPDGRKARCRDCYTEDGERYRFGLGREEVRALRSREVCDLCGNPGSPRKGLYIDHCHETGKVRGHLCSPCNAALGLMKDNAALLRRAAEYIESQGVPHATQVANAE